MTTVEMVKERIRGKGKGFASMSPERRHEVSQRGGEMAQLLGTGHRWTSETAREAGRKGGAMSRRGKREEQHGNTASN